MAPRHRSMAGRRRPCQVRNALHRTQPARGALQARRASADGGGGDTCECVLRLVLSQLPPREAPTTTPPAWLLLCCQWRRVRSRLGAPTRRITTVWGSAAQMDADTFCHVDSCCRHRRAAFCCTVCLCWTSEGGRITDLFNKESPSLRARRSSRARAVRRVVMSRGEHGSLTHPPKPHYLGVSFARHLTRPPKPAV